MSKEDTSTPMVPRLMHKNMLAVHTLLERLSDTYDLTSLAQLSPDLALKEAAPLLAVFAKKHALSMVEHHLHNKHGDLHGPYVAQQHTGHDGSYFLGIFVWPAGVYTQIHDHSCWCTFCCASGTLVEERYVRLDDGVQENWAHIRRAWQRTWNQTDGSSSLMPYEGGIHRVRNANTTPVISLHLYGPPSKIDGRDYDPAHDYVCDRPILE